MSQHLAATPLLLLVVAVAGCQVSLGRGLGGPDIDRSEAVELARDFLADLPFADDYHANPSLIVDEGDRWAIWYGKRGESGPAAERDFGVVTVTKRFGVRRWHIRRGPPV